MKDRNAAIVAAIFASVAALGTYAFAIHPAMMRRGATGDEVRGPWPGDDLGATGVARTTCGITIDAPARDIWPWIVQLGQDRAGFYSYRWLENAIGCNMPDVREIVPAFQYRAVGDTLWLAPHDRFGDIGQMIVARYEPDRAMVLVMADDGARLARGERMEGGSWGFILDERGPNETRFLTRSVDNTHPSPPASAFRALVFDSMHAIMERQMMRTIKRLAENRSTAAGSRATSGATS
jgi:hypothetical protein